MATVVVTGASAGVGRATAVAFARHGDRVALIARGREGLAAAASEVEAAGGRALGLPCDVSDAEAVEAAAARAEAELGPIDVWVNARDGRDPRLPPRDRPCRLPARDARTNVEAQQTQAALDPSRPDYLYEPLGDRGARGPFDGEAKARSRQLALAKRRRAVTAAALVGAAALAFRHGT